jgi:lambda family phage portal protein
MSLISKAVAKLFGRGGHVARTSVRMYAGARQSRLTHGWGTTSTSADSELASSLTPLRQRSRELVRDAAYAKRAKVVVVNNVIGSGVGMQAKVTTTRAGLNERVNDAIEREYREWSKSDSCHTGGSLHFCDLERMAMGQVFEAGEIFIRKHYRAFGKSRIPFALEVIEPERIADTVQPSPFLNATSNVRMGVELDEFYRPVAYFIRKRHPSDFTLAAGPAVDMVERVPADQIFHLRIIDRWPQTRGEPWMHSAMRRLNDMNGYSEAEIVAARGAANYMAVIETPETVSALMPDTGDGPEIVLEPGIVDKLAPGEKLNFINPGRPNANMDPFMRMMLREVAAGIGVSYESLSRDYSRSNYSSSRLALLEDRDLWRVFQSWWIRNFREPLHSEWLQQAVLSGSIPEIGIEAFGIDPVKFGTVRFKPRGWSWVDPTKEVDAFEKAVRNGFTTTTDVIAQTANGRDIEDVLEERKQELDMMKAAGLVFDTDPSVNAALTKPPKEAAPKAEDDDDPPDDEEDDEAQDDPAPRRVVSFGRP